MALATAAALIGAGSSLLAGLFGSSAASKAAKVAKQGALDAGKAANEAAIGANKGIDSQTNAAQKAISEAVAKGEITTDNSTGAGIKAVNDATKNANEILNKNLASAKENYSPYMDVGKAGAGALQKYIENPFTLPTAEEARATPGYQFRQQSGQQAISNSSIGRGASGGTLKALAAFGTNLADTYYQSDVSNKLAAFNTNVNTARSGADLGMQATNAFSDIGLKTAGLQSSNLTNAGQFEGEADINAGRYKSDLAYKGAAEESDYGYKSAVQMGQNSINAAQYAGNALMGGANSEAAGKIGSANAWSGAISNAGTSLLNIFKGKQPLNAPSIRDDPGSMLWRTP